MQQLAIDFPGRPDFRQDVARCHIDLGNLLRKTGRLKEAEAACRNALALLQQLATDLPARPAFRRAAWPATDSLGELLAATGRPKEAEAAFPQSPGHQQAAGG